MNINNIKNPNTEIVFFIFKQQIAKHYFQNLYSKPIFKLRYSISEGNSILPKP
jgi:hypothetical protein